MDFQTAVKSGFNKLAIFEGRASRSEYWWYSLGVLIAVLVLSFVGGALLGSAMTLVIAVVGTGLMLAVGVRRIQDVGKPAAWVYAYYGVYLLWVIMQMIMPSLASIPGLATLVMGLGLLYFFVQPGQPDSNAHGPNPLGGAAGPAA